MANIEDLAGHVTSVKADLAQGDEAMHTAHAARTKLISTSERLAALLDEAIALVVWEYETSGDRFEEVALIASDGYNRAVGGLLSMGAESSGNELGDAKDRTAAARNRVLHTTGGRPGFSEQGDELGGFLSPLTDMLTAARNNVRTIGTLAAQSEATINGVLGESGQAAALIDRYVARITGEGVGQPADSA